MIDGMKDTIIEFLEILPIGAIIVDESNYITYFNTQASEALSLPKVLLKYIRLEEACPALYKDGKLKKDVVFENDHEKKTYEIMLQEWHNLRVVFLQDISQMVHAVKENNMLRTVFDAIHEGVQISDAKGVTTLYNHACENFECLSREDVIGKRIVEVYDVTDETSVHQNVLRTGKPVIEHHHQYHTCDGNLVEVIASTFPYYEGKEIVGAYSINRDVTKMKEFISRTVELQKRLVSSVKGQGSGNGAYYTFDHIIGGSKAIQDVIASARKISHNHSSVLIYGDTGTGKELFAQSIHNCSLNAEGPFIPINCAAIPETLLESLLFGTVKGAFTGALESPGLFEQAENGTLFLDEINSMSLHLQAKLLRVIQEKSMRRIGDSVQRRVNCRIISSTNREPQSAVNEHQIRQDLYYRLAAVTLFIPALEERKEDIIPLVQHFIKKYNKQFGTNIKTISPQLEDMFMNYSWPGNVRELEHVIESAFNMVDSGERTLQMDHLAVYLRKRFAGLNSHIQQINSVSGTLNDILMDVEKTTIIQTLKKYNGNISQAAKELGVFRQALQYRIKRFNININE